MKVKNKMNFVSINVKIFLIHKINQSNVKNTDEPLTPSPWFIRVLNLIINQIIQGVFIHNLINRLVYLLI